MSSGHFSEESNQSRLLVQQFDKLCKLNHMISQLEHQSAKLYVLFSLSLSLFLSLSLSLFFSLFFSFFFLFDFLQLIFLLLFLNQENGSSE